MAAFFVTGSGTDIGKTWICAGLLRYWRAGGLDPAALKPVVSGYDESAPRDSDPAVLLDALGLAADRTALETMAPFRLRAPLAPDQAAALEGRTLSLQEVVRACHASIDAAKGPLLIEGAGGVMSPLNAKETMLDLAVALGLPVLFVAGSYLGAISHALTGLCALRAKGLAVAAVVVDESGQDSVGLAETAASLAGHVPDTTVLAAPRNAQAASWARITAALGVS